MSTDLHRPSLGDSLAERVASRLGEGRADYMPVSAPPIDQRVEREPIPAFAPPPIKDVSEPKEPERASLQINFAKLRAAGYITPTSPRTNGTESIRIIKRRLLKTAFPRGRRHVSGENNNVIVITSSMPGEGKTFISLNLAMSFCVERDLFVLLIDGDCHRRHLGNLLDAKEEAGLIDILEDNTLQVGDMIQRTNIPNLSFLSGGHPHLHSAELMASKQFGVLMQDIAARYSDRIIIVDSPPVLASAEAVVLSSLVGQTVVVVEKDRTSKRQLQRTLELLEGGRNVGCILNMVAAEEVFTGYGY